MTTTKAKTRTTTRASAAPKIASAKELQAKALQALGKKTSKPMTEAAAIKAALNAITKGAHGAIYSLLDFGEGFEHSRFTQETSHMLAAALCDQGRDAFADAADSIAHLKHPAIKFLRRAADALDDAERITQALAQIVEGGGGNEFYRGVQRRYGRVAGKAIHAFTLEAARWMERAEDELSDAACCGFLGVLSIPGFPDDEFFRITDELSKGAVLELRRLSEQQKAHALDCIMAIRQGRTVVIGN